MEIEKLKDYAVLAEGLTKKFGNVTAVKDLDFKVKRGGDFWSLRLRWSGEDYDNADALWHPCTERRLDVRGRS